MRNIRTWQDIEDARGNGLLTQGEEQLIAHCQQGQLCDLSDLPTPQRQVGADLLRYLITGGCEEGGLHDRGVQLHAAQVVGRLDLSFAKARGMTRLADCDIAEGITALQAEFEFLNLSGSRVAGLDAQGAKVGGNVFLRDGFAATGEVSFSGAEIGGQLDCSKGGFDNKGGKALNAQDVKVGGSVFLHDGFAATGEVSFSSAEIGGQLACSNGRFDHKDGEALNAQGAKVGRDVFLSDGFTATGEVSFSGAAIGGQLACSDGRFDNEGGMALDAQNIRVAELYWREVAEVAGLVDVNGANIGTLVDDASSWEKSDGIILSGFTYAHIIGPADFQMRLDWLEKGTAATGQFDPQPYEQLAKVLDGMGHDRDRRRVQIAKEIRQRRFEIEGLRDKRAFLWVLARFSAKPTEERAKQADAAANAAGQIDRVFRDRYFNRLKTVHRDWPKNAGETLHPAQQQMANAGIREELLGKAAGLSARIGWLHVLDKVPRWLVGYGYQPFKFGWALLLLVAVGWLLAYQTWNAGQFAPNSDVILSTAEWQGLAEDEGVANAAGVWSSATEKGRDYESFHPGAYAFDVVVPIISLGQEAAWAPSTADGRWTWGWWLWQGRWFLAALGWIVTAVGAAAITGIIRRE